MHNTYMIVGIDPGKTVGLAGINLDGDLIFLDHKEFATEAWIIKRISENGTPVIIAGDKPNHSELIDKTNAAFNSRLFYPERVLKASEKRGISNKMKIKNIHESDAYAAAVKAFNAYKNKFMQVSKNETEHDKDLIKAKIIQKYSVNEAIYGKKSNRK
ncbi:MAG: DUF460 domain-containing protein [Candidatus Micrarchaeia archaeon]